MRMTFNFSLFSSLIQALGITNSKLPPTVSGSYVLIVFKNKKVTSIQKISRKFLRATKIHFAKHRH